MAHPGRAIAVRVAMTMSALSADDIGYASHSLDGRHSGSSSIPTPSATRVT